MRSFVGSGGGNGCDGVEEVIVVGGVGFGRRRQVVVTLGEDFAIGGREGSSFPMMVFNRKEMENVQTKGGQNVFLYEKVITTVYSGRCQSSMWLTVFDRVV